jgi:hypothetical protein
MMIDLKPITCLSALAILSACGGVGGGEEPFQGTPVESRPAAAEAEPNEWYAPASALSDEGAGHGVLTTGVGTSDVDVWSFDAIAGEVYSVDVFALRHDYYGWRDNCDKPSITLLDRDGGTALLSHDATTLGELHGDRGFPRWRAPATETYFIELRAQAGGQGAYAITLDVLEEAYVLESGEPNDDLATAEPISPGLLAGTCNGSSMDEDYYSFEIVEASILRVEMVSYRNGKWGEEDKALSTMPDLVGDDGTVLSFSTSAYAGDRGFDLVVTNPGTYYLRVFSFTDLASISNGAYWMNFEQIPLGTGAEQEPNDTLVDADLMAYGGILSGSLDGTAADVGDILAFDGERGDLVRLHLYGRGTSVGEIGTMGALILDSNGDEIAVSGDTSGTEGSATIRILRALLPSTGTYYLHLTDESETGVLAWSVDLELVAQSLWESESNGAPSTADPLSSVGMAAGLLESATGIDAYAFKVDAPGLVVLDLNAAASANFVMPHHDGHGSSCVPALNVQAKIGGVMTTLAESLSPSNACGFANGIVTPLPSLSVSFVAASAGTHYAIVGTEEETVDGNAHYLLEID